MSHWSLVKIKIKNPNQQLLIATIKEIAKELNGEIVNKIVDYYGRERTDFLIAFKSPEFHRGVGVKINQNGDVEIVGDFYGYSDKIKNLQMKIIQYYTKNAMIYSLRKMRYHVQTKKVQDKILLQAVSW